MKNVLSAKHKHNFDNYLTAMSSLGYTNYYQVLNAKDYEIPQNRERVFTISVLDNTRFQFPPKQELKLRLKDMLEDEVDRKYYLSDEQVEKIKTSTFHTNARRIQEKDWCDTLCARDWKDPKCVEVKSAYMQGGNRQPMIIGSTQEHSAISTNGIVPTLTSAMGQGGGHVPMMLIKNATQKGYQEAYEGDSVNLAYPDSTTRRGRVGSQVAQTLQCNDNMGVVVDDMVEELEPKIIDTNFSRKREYTEYSPTIDTYVNKLKVQAIRIRKLTPKECWRLMGFDDTDIDKCIEIGMSNTQLYKQAGNSIVVNVLEAILKNLVGVQ